MAFSISMFIIKISDLTTDRLNHLVLKTQILLKMTFFSNSIQFKIMKSFNTRSYTNWHFLT